MTPQTRIIDRNFRGVGRIKRATGTTEPKIVRQYGRMLDAFRDDGRVDLLRSIRDGVLTLAQAYDAHRRGTLAELATGETAKPLQEAYAAWLKGLIVGRDISEKHKGSFVTSGRYFAKADKRAHVADLPRLLRKMRETLGAEHPRSFNLARSAASKFVRSTLTKAHPLYLAVNAVEKRKEGAKRKGKPLSLVQMRNWFPSPESDPLDDIAWGMVTTGMHESEYWGAWSVGRGKLHIDGTKRAGRDRDVPLVRAPSAPTIHPRTFTDNLRDRTNRQIQPYDLRRTYAHWLESAGIPRTRRKLYMGHGAQDVTDLYERHEVEAFLADDAKRLADFLGLPTKTTTMTLHKRGAK